MVYHQVLIEYNLAGPLNFWDRQAERMAIFMFKCRPPGFLKALRKASGPSHPMVIAKADGMVFISDKTLG
jgi:hypothetical protein